MNHDFYEIRRHDLEDIEILLDTEQDNDWIQLFAHNDSKGYTYCQFNEEMDLVDSRRIRISSDLAFKIWSMVESSDIKEVKRKEIECSKNIDEALGY